MAAFEVIALDTATPQLRAPGASDTYTFPRAVELPLGTANGVLYLNASKVVTSGSGLVFDSSGNLGLGVTPSGWASLYKAFTQSSVNTSTYSFWEGAQPIIGMVNGGFVNAAYSWEYTVSGRAVSRYAQEGDGAHAWFTAPSGTAGNAISFSQVMTLDASGNLGVGETSPSQRLHIKTSAAAIALFDSTDANGGYLTFSRSGTAKGYIGSSYHLIIPTGSNDDFAVSAVNNLTFATGTTERARITSGGNFVVGTAALATTATDGFLYVPTCAGTPTGTPTTQTGTAPIVVDTTNNKLYFYSGGQWRDAGP